jgi:hypothetical protein
VVPAAEQTRGADKHGGRVAGSPPPACPKPACLHKLCGVPTKKSLLGAGTSWWEGHTVC